MCDTHSRRISFQAASAAHFIVMLLVAAMLLIWIVIVSLTIVRATKSGLKVGRKRPNI